MKKVKAGYKMTELGEIPEDWEIGTLGDIFSLCQYGISDSLSIDGTYPVLRMNNIQKGKVKFDDLKFIDLDKEVLDKYSLRRNDILFNRTNSIDLVGKTGLYDSDELSTFASYLIRITVNKNVVDSKFVNYYMNSYDGQIRIRNYATLGVSQANINAENLKNVEIMLPGLKEQQKIASILSSVDEQIEITDNLIEKIKELKKGLMQKLLTKGIGHKQFKDTEMGRIPDSWEIIPFFNSFSKIIDFRGKTPKKLGMDWGGDIIALSANNVKMGKVDFELETYYGTEELYDKWMAGNELSKGDLLMTMEAPLGNIALVPDNRKYILSQRVVALKTYNFIDNIFMKYLLMSNIIQNQFIVLSTGTTAKGINQKNLAKVLLLIPCLKEQQKIASILSSVDQQIEEYEAKKEKFQDLKKGLMQTLLTGKIRVKI